MRFLITPFSQTNSSVSWMGLSLSMEAGSRTMARLGDLGSAMTSLLLCDDPMDVFSRRECVLISRVWFVFDPWIRSEVFRERRRFLFARRNSMRSLTPRCFAGPNSRVSVPFSIFSRMRWMMQFIAAHSGWPPRMLSFLFIGLSETSLDWRVILPSKTS